MSNGHGNVCLICMRRAAGCARLMLAGLAFAGLTVLLTWPHAIRATDHVRAGPNGRPHEDALQNVWMVAWQAKSSLTQPQQFWDTNLYYPRTNTLAYCPVVVGYAPVSALLARLTHNPVLTYNLCVLAAIPFCGLAMFCLVRHLTGNTLAAGVSGFAFAFMPLRYSYYGQLHIPSSHWLVLALWALHAYTRRQRLLYAATCLLCTFLQGLFCGYYLVFFCTLLPVFWLVVACTQRRFRDRRNLMLAVAFFPVLAALLVPFYWPYVEHGMKMGYSRTIEDAARYSADILSYFSAPRWNVLYGHWLRPMPAAETQAFPGIALSLLAITGVASGFRKKGPLSRQAVICYVAFGATAFVLSLGPVVHIAGRALCPGPFLLLHEFVPGYSTLRVPGRYGMFVMVALCVLAGYGITALLRLPLRWRTALLTLACVLMGAESLHVPIRLARVPLKQELSPVYDWLRRQPQDAALVEVPLDLAANDYDYVYRSIYHWRRLVNGVSGYYPPENVAKYLLLRRGLASDECPRLLAELGVDYAIIHADRMPVPVHKLVLAPGFQFVRRFGDAHVFRVTSAHAEPRHEAQRPWREVARHAWRVAVNAPSNSPAHMLDDDSQTLWRTTVPPREGMGLTLDLGATSNLGRIRMEFGPAGNEFPRYFRVRVSKDGRAWRQVVGEAEMPRCWADVYRSALAHPRNPLLDLTFPAGGCRYLVIELLPHRGYSGWRWSMAEIRAYAPADNATIE